MKTDKTRLSADECLAFALECEADAQTEQDPEHRLRLLRIAAVLRALADDLRKTRPTFAGDESRR
jgi:hypothetical protein